MTLLEIRTDGAIANFNKAIELNPSLADANQNRGIAKLNLNDNAGAITDFNKVIELNPKLAGACVNRGSAKFGLEDIGAWPPTASMASRN
jgi:tetratricopeptide (TPR) repeat protein